MAARRVTVAVLLCFAAAGCAFPLQSKNNASQSLLSQGPGIVSRANKDPTDFSWITKWAAIGDSFTAGIGSGNQLGIYLTEDWKCSRYDYAWPKIVNNALGGTITDFQFTACSGDRTEGIFNQVLNLNGPLDLVMMTAGGNDLCLAAMIKECVFLPWRGEDACQTVIDKAQENIDAILKPNIRQVLDALNAVVNQDAVVVYNGYAPFFNVENEDCSDTSKQYWAIKEWWWVSYWFSTPLPLDITRRTKFNNLVSNINKAISEVVDEYATDTSIKYKITFSDWSSWPAIVDGEMCSPRGDGHYPDPKQPDLMFFKRNTYVAPSPYHDSLKRDEDEASAAAREAYINEVMMKRIAEDSIYDSLLYKSRDPRAVALHALDPRSPEPPNCPGDGSGIDPPFGLGLPDSFLENFHPNEKGHEAIAAYSLENLVWARSKVLGIDDPICEVIDDFTCWSSAGRKAYASWDRLNINYKDFCDSVSAPANTINWNFEKTYHEGTPEEQSFSLQLSDGAFEYDKAECLASLDRILNSCDGGRPDNPLNFKFGGQWVRGGYTFEINPKKDRELYTRTDGDCEGWYKVFYSDYHIRGRGWADWDHGQETLLPQIKSCLGLGVTGWKFDYCDADDDCDGYEWTSSFHTPIWVNARCFENLKVVGAAGGYTHSLGGSYEDYGCAGNDA